MSDKIRYVLEIAHCFYMCVKIVFYDSMKEVEFACGLFSKHET